ncbi:cytidine deaminase 1-like isoform X2 [Telopea speciosissima]|uniref:cytidine deaminase 1-like isoform X2 n=1 Tax=Telopea speciosissima TaxID=54955 RepID=UPI001CC445DB|nr:cytidine deaminase 1-like isoform X2 [Telopea speciosissima]
MERNQFVIEAAEVKSMTKESGLSVLQLVPCLVKSAQKLARPPISKYHVGAVGLGSGGRIFLGANVEFPGLPLHHSIHAEQFLVTNAAIHGETQLKYIALSTVPCGHCRQFLQEIRGASEIKILVSSIENVGGGHQNGEDEDETFSFRPLSTFLPHRFGPNDLLDRDVPLLLEPRHNALSFIDNNHENNIVIGDINCNGDVADHEKKLKCAALEAANESHAPYSVSPSGVALMDVEGRIYKGSYMESAAYNPSLGPVQAALVGYVAAGGGGGYDRIVAGVLVEKEGAIVVQDGTARLLMLSVSPRCDFRVFRYKST